MALIIPEAQTPFNPAGQPRLNPNAASGAEGIGAVADTFIAIKAQKVKVEQDRAVRSARLTAMEELDKVRFKYETDTNLDGLTDRWEAEAGKSTAAIAATLPAHLRGDFEVAMREMAAPQTSAIRRREYALFQDQERAYLNADLRSYEARAAAAPTEEARDADLTTMSVPRSHRIEFAAVACGIAGIAAALFWRWQINIVIFIDWETGRELSYSATYEDYIHADHISFFDLTFAIMCSCVLAMSTAFMVHKSGPDRWLRYALLVLSGLIMTFYGFFLAVLSYSPFFLVAGVLALVEPISKFSLGRIGASLQGR